MNRKGAKDKKVLGYDRRNDIFASYVLHRQRFTNTLAGNLVAAKQGKIEERLRICWTSLDHLIGAGRGALACTLD